MRKLARLVLIICMLVYILAVVVDTAFASAPAGKFAPVNRNGVTATPSSAKQTPTQCVMIGISKCYVTGSPIPYAFAPGTILKIKGQKWAAKATVILYLVPIPGIPLVPGQAQPGNTVLCPAPSALKTDSVAYSAQETTNALGAFSAQLILPTTPKVDISYFLCISVTNSGHATSRLLFQVEVHAASQQQTGGVVIPDNLKLTTSSVAPSSYVLSIVALALVLIALLLFFLSSRQPFVARPNEKRNVL